MGCPSFFKVLFNDDFSRLLRLPPVIGRKYGEVLPERAELRSSSGKTWNVKMEPTGDEEEQYCFTQGWSEFAKDARLEIGEFLMFCFHGISIFDVSVFGINGCEREISGRNLVIEVSVLDDDDDVVEVSDDSKNQKSSEQEARKAVGSSRSDDLFFEIRLKPHQISRVTLPKKFVVAAGLKDKKTVKVEYVPKGKNKVVLLDHRTKQFYRTDMTAGWSKFRKANGLVIGQNYSLEFKPSMNVIQVKKLDKEK